MLYMYICNRLNLDFKCAWQSREETAFMDTGLQFKVTVNSTVSGATSTKSTLYGNGIEQIFDICSNFCSIGTLYGH